LESVLDAGFDMQRAWHPRIYICAAVFLDELIIELEEPDIRPLRGFRRAKGVGEIR
jgi:hypothetical protein